MTGTALPPLSRSGYRYVTGAVGPDGRVRWRFRRRSIDRYLQGEPGSSEFLAQYAAALAESQGRKHTAVVDTWDALIARYCRSAHWLNLAPATKRSYGIDLDAISCLIGPCPIEGLRSVHIDAMLADMADRPSAANHMLKMLRRLVKFALDMQWMSQDPTRAARFYKIDSDGFYTWTSTDIALFRNRFPAGSPARLALELGLYTGAARVDIVRLGPRSVIDGSVRYRRSKSREEVVVPLHRELKKVLDLVPQQQTVFLTRNGKPFTPETVGAWFSDCASEAGVREGTLHGLRKAMATQMAHAGCSEKQIAAYLGHRSTRQAEVYTRKANNALLAADAFRLHDGWIIRATEQADDEALIAA